MLDKQTLTCLFGRHIPLKALPERGIILIDTPAGDTRVVEVMRQLDRLVEVGTGKAVVHTSAVLLSSATKRLQAYRGSVAEADDAALPRVAQQAKWLELVYGTAYYLSPSVVANMLTGRYVFVVGFDSHPQVGQFDAAAQTVNDSSLCLQDAMYFSLDNKPVFLLMDVTGRL